MTLTEQIEALRRAATPELSLLLDVSTKCDLLDEQLSRLEQAATKQEAGEIRAEVLRVDTDGRAARTSIVAQLDLFKKAIERLEIRVTTLEDVTNRQMQAEAERRQRVKVEAKGKAVKAVPPQPRPGMTLKRTRWVKPTERYCWYCGKRLEGSEYFCSTSHARKFYVQHRGIKMDELGYRLTPGQKVVGFAHGGKVVAAGIGVRDD